MPGLQSSATTTGLRILAKPECIFGSFVVAELQKLRELLNVQNRQVCMTQPFPQHIVDLSRFNA